MTQILTSHATCPKCWAVVDSTEWRPAAGYDPNLRQFKCVSCKLTFYQVMHGVARREEQKKKELQQRLAKVPKTAGLKGIIERIIKSL